jgi:hypothetical protein
MALGWVVVLSMRRAPGEGASSQPLASWQRSHREMSEADQRRFRSIRIGLLQAEKVRGATGQWPEVLFDDPQATWVKRRHGVYVNYLAASGATRWLVLFIEPEPKKLNEKSPQAPIDDEHHTLCDGTELHVTVWSTPNEGELPAEVLAFPVTEGWVQRL